MQYYLAPLEGITGYIYRNAYHKYFTPMHKYFTPFIETHTKRSFNTREKNDILPEHNEGLCVVPQLLTNQADDFIKTAKDLKKLGYEEVNLNLGCPSGTVFSKKRGAGFLAEPEELERFLYTIFEQVSIAISIKTRIGVENSEEFPYLLSIFNKYPVKELIVHPRLRNDFYKNKPNLDVFEVALKNSNCNICYNGDLFRETDVIELLKRFPHISSIMLGRGVIANPFLPAFLMQDEDLIAQNKKERLKAFHDEILRGYCEVILGDKNVLFKMKELWTYLSCIFTNSEKYCKKIRKAERIREYEHIVAGLFREQELIEDGGFII